MERVPAAKVSPSTAARGGVLTVRLDTDSGDQRASRVELLLVERKLAAKMNYKHNHSRVVASVDAEPGTESVDLVVPAWLPDTYVGTNVGWDYEVRVVTQARGLDKKDITPIVVTGGVPVDTDADGGADLRRSVPLMRASPLGLAPKGGEWSGVAIFGVPGAIALGIGLKVGSIIPLILGVVLLLFAIALAYDTLRPRPLLVEDLVMEVPEGVHRPGDVVEVRITSPIAPGLEIGLEAIEIYVDAGSNGKHGYRETVVEEYRPLDGPVMRLQASVTAPGGYAGDEVALHWVVGARAIGTEQRLKRIQTMRAPIIRTF